MRRASYALPQTGQYSERRPSPQVFEGGSNDAQGVTCHDFFEAFEEGEVFSGRNRRSQSRTYFTERDNEQAMNGHTERLGQYAPKRGLDTADRAVNDASGGTCACRGKPKLAKQTMIVARAFAVKE
jgi:hypothetical protein